MKRPSDFGDYSKEKEYMQSIAKGCGNGKGDAMRRPLPEIDDSAKMERNDQKWLNWCLGIPQQAGWYWVCRDGIWPQCVEFRYVKGKIAPVDRHGLQDPNFWTLFAGPIPDPIAPKFKNGDIYYLSRNRSARRRKVT